MDACTTLIAMFWRLGEKDGERTFAWGMRGSVPGRAQRAGIEHGVNRQPAAGVGAARMVASPAPNVQAAGRRTVVPPLREPGVESARYAVACFTASAMASE